MQESAPSRVAWWKYLVWGVVTVAVFGLSVGGGVFVATRQSGARLMVENKQGLYSPEVSNEALVAYLKYAGLSERVEQARLTYEPAELPEVAYTRLNQGTVDVMIDLKAEEKVVRLWMYYNPELFEHMLASPERLAADVLAGVCLALNPGTMPDCMKQAFEYMDWAKEAGIPAVIQPVTQRSWWRKIVPQVYAGCSGTVPCGADVVDCSCSISGPANCSYNGQACGTGNVGTCSCPTICDTTQNNLQCSALEDQNACNTLGTLSNCDKKCSVSRPDSGNYCTWGGGGGSTPVPTTPASCGNGTCGSGESCSNCPADCGVCTEITWAYITVTVYGDNGLQAPSNRTQEPSSGSNTCKGYEFASSSTGTSWNAYGNCQHSWLLDMAKTDKSMNISGIDSKYSDCQVKLNNTVINSSFANGKCSVPSRTYNQYNDSLVITLLKSRPNADFTAGPVNNTEIGYGLNYQWTNSATDANGNMKSWGIYVRETGGSFSPIGWSSNNSGVASATITSNTWACSKKNQEYEVAVNAKEGDPPLLECSGGSANAYNITSTQAQTRCASGDDLRKVTCVVPSCTFTAAPTNVSTGATGKFSASSNNAKLIQMQYRLKGTETWTNLSPNEAGTDPNKSADITCTSAMAGKTYEVKCNAWFGEAGTNPKCYGGNGTADGSDYFDCGTNDFKEFSCGTTPSCTLSMTGLSLNPNGTGTLTANVVDKTGLECSGDPTGSATRCASGNDRKVFTCSSPSPTCAAPGVGRDADV